MAKSEKQTDSSYTPANTPHTAASDTSTTDTPAAEVSGYGVLDRIDSPEDLRRLPVEQLPEVCRQIRRKLIDSLAVNPGHFASSMGAVELTVALHYVFSTPYDRIVWDVGHQAYGHKLLTGRREAFAGNRCLNGISGFPNPDESEYDTFTAGHASNSISAALGMAVASAMQADTPRRQVVAVIGDASISGGLAFEGLNNAANTPNNLLIILNDNNMSIDDNVGALHTYLSKITTSRGYNNLRYKAYNLLKRMHLVSESRKGSILRLNNSLKSFLSHQQNIFEGLDIRYFGPVDGHDVASLIKTLNDIKDMTGPKILHIKTIKGKGYAPAEKSPSVWHAPGKFDAATGVRLQEIQKDKGKKAPKFQDVFGDTLLELARKDPKVVGITAAMPSGTSIATMQREMPGRVFDVGISEGHAVTFAGGLAKEGLHPFVAIYSSFLQRAYDQIIHDVAIQHLPVTFCIDRAGLVGEDGVTHHGLFDLAYLRVIPGLTIASPRDAASLRNLMLTALELVGPMAIRYPRGSAPAGEGDWHTPMHKLIPGRGEQLASGDDLTFLSIGPIASEVAKAVEMLRSEGIGAAHYDMVFLKPIDEEILQEAVNRGAPIITVEDGSASGGLGSVVAEYVALHAGDDESGAAIPVVNIGVPDQFVGQGTVAQLRNLCGISAEAIAFRARKLTGRLQPQQK